MAQVCALCVCEPICPSHLNSVLSYQPLARSLPVLTTVSHGLSLPLSVLTFFYSQQTRVELPHPSRGGSEGYHPTHRVDALAAAAQGIPVAPSPKSLQRWTFNGTGRKRKRGNAGATNLRGEHQLLLLVYRLTYPKATADEVRTFIALHSANPRIYSRLDITKRETELGFKRKKGSTTAFQAFTPVNVARRHNFWTMAYPFGVLGTPRGCLIDIDEAGLWLEKKQCAFGKAVHSVRVRAPGVYGHGEKWTLILGVDCAGHKWFRFAKVPGTTTAIFHTFVRDQILADPAVAASAPRTLMWDNLSAHRNAVVYNTVTGAGHRVLQRPPYRPVDGPIEYIFNQLQNQLTLRAGEISDDVTFSALVHSILTNLGGFDATFVHCGYV